MIFVDENIPYLTSILEQNDKVFRFNGRNLQNSELIEFDCDMLFVRSTTNVGEELLKNTSIKFVGTSTSGFDHIDTKFLHSNNIHFAYAPGSNANSVAEYVVFGILAWARIFGVSLKETTIGIIGFGNIGKIVAKYTNYMGLKVVVNDPPLKDDNFDFPDYVIYDELESLISKSDILTNHVPFSPRGKYATKNLLDYDILSKIRNRGLVIHASRGDIINEEDLLKCIQEKSLEVIIDTWENEPDINAELAKKSFLCTPHIAGYSLDGKIRGVMQMVESFEKYKSEKTNPKFIDTILSSYHHMPQERFSDYEALYQQLKQSRKLDDDHYNLMHSLKLSKIEKAIAFDKLRKNYPMRREIL